jgi:hypothetical protein
MTRIRNILPRRDGKMRKIFIAFTITMLLIPAMSFAQTNQEATVLRALHAKLSPAQETSEADTLWGITYVYQASGGGWWSGLAIRNGTSPNNQITVSLFDVNGTSVGWGTFNIAAILAHRVDMLSAIITSGYVPARGAVFISSSNYFYASLFVGNDSGGFSMIEKTASSF